MNGMRSCCLTIAGSDSGGNAGVQADMRTFRAYGLHGCTVLTALTAQNPQAVRAIHPVPATFVTDQLDAVLGVYSIAALKTGMLGDAAVIETVAGRLRACPAIVKVVDPVLVATSGAPLAGEGALQALMRDLLPLADVLTPNIPEAEALTGRPIRSDADIRRAATDLHARFGCAVLVKGGHAAGPDAEDILYDGHRFSSWRLPRIDHPVSTHGTGCTLAAALAAELARGRTLTAAVDGAKRYVHQTITTAYSVGPACGVLGF